MNTAATLLRDAGLTKDRAAIRLGHGDDGELLDRGDRVQRARQALDEWAHLGSNQGKIPGGPV